MLRHFQIKENGAGRSDALRHTLHAESLEGTGFQLGADFLVGGFRHECPGIERRYAGTAAEALAESVEEGAFDQDLVGRHGAEQDIGIFE